MKQRTWKVLHFWNFYENLSWTLTCTTSTITARFHTGRVCLLKLLLNLCNSKQTMVLVHLPFYITISSLHVIFILEFKLATNCSGNYTCCHSYLTKKVNLIKNTVKLVGIQILLTLYRIKWRPNFNIDDTMFFTLMDIYIFHVQWHPSKKTTFVLRNPSTNCQNPPSFTLVLSNMWSKLCTISSKVGLSFGSQCQPLEKQQRCS